MAQIAQEIRTNLRVIEETLDTYFRDTANSAVLPFARRSAASIAGGVADA